MKEKCSLKLSRQPKFPYEIRTDKHLLGELQINLTGFPSTEWYISDTSDAFGKIPSLGAPES